MGMSRRLFTKEFNLVATRRLEQGVSIAEVSRALEVNQNVFHRWRGELRQGPGNAFPAVESSAGREGDRGVGGLSLLSLCWRNRVSAIQQLASGRGVQTR